MNKGDLVQTVAAKTGLSQKEVNAIVTVLTEVIEEAVANGEKVTLVGFGTFEPRERQAREGRNPRTGKPMQIPATKVPAFSAGKLFKERVAS
ncbi:MAG: HU family DNA-binding protein [Cyanobacteriota bacterium]|nr:HU family DNA-binding protein [Cyanobacteriota bacterium]